MDLSNDFKRNETQALIEIENLRGGKEARLEREWLAAEKSEILPLPPGHEVISLSKNRIEYLNTFTGFSSERKLPPDPRTFSSMAFTAARILIPRLSLKIESLGAKGASQEILDSCESVLQAASQFILLEGGSGPRNSSDLDEPLTTPGSKLLRKDSKPYPDLKSLQLSSFDLLRDIQGFVSSLRSPMLKDGEGFGSQIPPCLPTPEEWQSLHMARRVKAIEGKAANFQIRVDKMYDHRQWRKFRGPTLEKMTIERQKTMERVRIQQLCEKAPVVKCKVRIHSIRIVGLKKPIFLSMYLRFDLNKVAATNSSQGH